MQSLERQLNGMKSSNLLGKIVWVFPLISLIQISANYHLTLWWWRLLSYKNQSIDLLNHERVKDKRFQTFCSCTDEELTNYHLSSNRLDENISKLKKKEHLKNFPNSRPYMSHLKTKIKRPVFQKNATKYKWTESCLALRARVSAIFPCQITFRTMLKIF